MSRAIDIGKSDGMEDKENMKVAEGCRRLIKNAIICWNYLYITNLLINEPDKMKRSALYDSIKNGPFVPEYPGISNGNRDCRLQLS